MTVESPSAHGLMPKFRDVQIAAAMAVFLGSRLTRRRTPEDFRRFWDELTRRADARKRAETLAAVRLEHLRRQSQPTRVGG
jgi:hypothetical protein